LWYPPSCEPRDFIEGLDTQGFPIRRVPGVGVFLNPNLRSTPYAFRANVERNPILHDHVIIVSVRIERVAHVPDPARVVPEKRIMFSGATGAMARNAASPAEYFRLPDNQTVTMSWRIQL
jgi:K+ transporter